MAITTPVLAGYSLPQPAERDGYSPGRTYRGGSMRLADGSLVYDLVNDTYKRTFELSWRNISEANRAIVDNAFNAIRKASAAFTAPDGQTATVNRAESQTDLVWSTQRAANNTIVYSGTLRLEEV